MPKQELCRISHDSFLLDLHFGGFGYELKRVKIFVLRKGLELIGVGIK